MGKQAFDQKLEALEALRAAPDAPSTVEQLRKALKDRNGYAVSKAAHIVGELQLRALVPDLVAAFERLLIEPVKSDPQCWGKNAIVKALKDLEHHDATVYLRGTAHVQLEPVWGGQEDTAATLRGACALALVDCALDDFQVLIHLTELLADREKPVRIDAARAVGQMGREEGALLLRLKALTGDKETEVTGQCLACLLSLSPRDSITFVGRFLDHESREVRLEAAGALAESREPEALDALKRHWERRLDPETRRAILALLGGCPQPEAAEFLLKILDDASGDTATAALSALAASRFRENVRERVAAIVERKQDPKLNLELADQFAG